MPEIFEVSIRIFEKKAKIIFFFKVFKNLSLIGKLAHEEKKILTSAKIHNFDLKILDLGVELCHLDFQVVSLLVDFVALGMDLAAQIAQFIVAYEVLW